MSMQISRRLRERRFACSMMDGATTGSVLVGLHTLAHRHLNHQRKSMELAHQSSPYRRKILSESQA